MNTLISEKINDEVVVFDVYTKLANDRILFINGFIDSTVASDICATLLLKDSENNKKITLFLNSEGGDLRDVFMIYDCMKMISSPIETVCFGGISDTPVILFAGGTPGMRFITKNSSLTFCQLTHDRGYYKDLIEAKSTLNRSINDNKRMMEIIASCTNKSVKDIFSKFERRICMNAKEAVNFGFADKIVKSKR
jgi:ATP-dependent Clp protease, protease subunit